MEDRDRGGARGTEQELPGAGNGRQAPIAIKVAFLGSMLGSSALFNTGTDRGSCGRLSSLGAVASHRLIGYIAPRTSLRTDCQMES